MAMGGNNEPLADALALPFEEGFFDAMIAMHMACHVSDRAKGITKLHRVLRIQGSLAVKTIGMGNKRRMYELATVVGNPPSNPTPAAFGFDTADRLMRPHFGNVTMASLGEPLDHGAGRCRPGADILSARGKASEAQLVEFRKAIVAAFQQVNGILEVKKEAEFSSVEEWRDRTPTLCSGRVSKRANWKGPVFSWEPYLLTAYLQSAPPPRGPGETDWFSAENFFVRRPDHALICDDPSPS